MSTMAHAENVPRTNPHDEIKIGCQACGGDMTIGILSGLVVWRCVDCRQLWLTDVPVVGPNREPADSLSKKRG